MKILKINALCIKICFQFILVLDILRRNKMSTFQKICLVFTIIGAINWGLIGIFSFDLVSYLFGEMTFLTRTVFTIVGLTGLINIGILTMPLE